MNSHFDLLCRILFDGPVKVHDIKTLRGTDSSADREAISAELLASLRRMGVVVGESVADINGALAATA